MGYSHFPENLTLFVELQDLDLVLLSVFQTEQEELGRLVVDRTHLVGWVEPVRYANELAGAGVFVPVGDKNGWNRMLVLEMLILNF